MNPNRCRALLVLAVACSSAAALSASPWRPVGPWGGTVVEVVRSPAEPSVLYATASGGIHRSTDGGLTWASAHGDLPRRTGFGVGQLTPDPSHAETLWGAGDGTFWQTRDGGAHWTARQPPAAGARLFAVAPGGETLFAGGAAGLFQSHDRGLTWQRLRRGFQPGYGVVGLSIDASDPRRVWASVRGKEPGVYMTHDGGASWRRVLAKKLFLLRADPHSAGVVVGWDGANVLRSLDAGRSWQVLATPPSPIQSLDFGPGSPSRILYLASYDILARVFAIDGASGAVSELDAAPAQDFGANVIAASPSADGGILVGGYRGFVRSDDQGATWVRSDTGFAGAFSGPIAILGAASWLAGNERTADGGKHWTHFLPGQTVTALAFAPNDRRVVYAGTRLARIDGGPARIYKSTDGGTTWERSAKGLRSIDVTAVAVDPRDPATLYLATEYDGVFQSRDAAAHWRRLTGDAPTGATQLTIAGTAAHCLFVTTFKGLRRSCDDGATWDSLLELSSALDVALSRTDSSRIYAVEGYTDASRPPLRYWRSVDGGASFVALPLPIPPESTSFTAHLAIDERRPDTVYLAGSPDSRDGNVWVWTGEGPWHELGDGLGSREHLRHLAYDAGAKPRLFVSTAAGVYLHPLAE